MMRNTQTQLVARMKEIAYLSQKLQKIYDEHSGHPAVLDMEALLQARYDELGVQLERRTVTRNPIPKIVEINSRKCGDSPLNER
jgi:hypothetical protein